MPIYLGNSTSQLRVAYEGSTYTTGDNYTGTTLAPYFTFSAHTFTAAGVIGRTGPSLAALQSAYSAQTWASNTSYFNIVGSGIQKWLVPKSGTYKIQCAGAPGSRGSDAITNGMGYSQGVPGNGIIVSANFYLYAGDILYILVGQQGIEVPTAANSSDTDGGAGGGTYVAKKVANSRYYFTPDSCNVVPLVVAGGGAGGSSDGNGQSGIYANWQGGSAWNPIGSGLNGASMGGGFSPAHRPSDANLPGYSIDVGFATGATAGPNGQGRSTGQSFLEGGIGGYGRSYTGSYITGGNGGFGGGGGSTDEYGAGGGGWVGGLNGDNVAVYSSQGGTSYISPEGTSASNDGYNTWAAQTTNGYCTITFIA
jgi:hypothetical protein